MAAGPDSIGEYPGVWLGTIVLNDDTDNPRRNRTKVMVPGVYDDDADVDELPWAELCSPNYGNAHGPVATPPVGCTVWVMFRQGHSEHPVIMGGQIIQDDSIQGTKHEVIDGDHSKLVTKAIEETSQSRDISVTGSESRTVEKTSTHNYGSLEHIVIGGVVYSYGSETGEISGPSKKTIKGSSETKILGVRKENISSSSQVTIGGDERKFIMGQLLAQVSNVMGLPTAKAVDYNAINGFFRAGAANILGLNGSEIMLDPLGIQTTLSSLVTLLIDANVMIRIGKLAFLPAVLPLHTHLSGFVGTPTGPVLPLPGALSAKVFIE